MAKNNAQALKAARQFVSAVQGAGIQLEAAYLYGSYAKGTSHPDSDIDVALISKDFSGWVDDLERIRTALLTMDSRIEHVRIRPDNFVDENPLAWEIKTTGIPLIKNQKNDKRSSFRKPARAKRTRPG